MDDEKRDMMAKHVVITITLIFTGLGYCVTFSDSIPNARETVLLSSVSGLCWWALWHFRHSANENQTKSMR